MPTPAGHPITASDQAIQQGRQHAGHPRHTGPSSIFSTITSSQCETTMMQTTAQQQRNGEQDIKGLTFLESLIALGLGFQCQLWVEVRISLHLCDDLLSLHKTKQEKRKK